MAELDPRWEPATELDRAAARFETGELVTLELDRVRRRTLRTALLTAWGHMADHERATIDRLLEDIKALGRDTIDGLTP
jgi:hypothetical protein